MGLRESIHEERRARHGIFRFLGALIASLTAFAAFPAGAAEQYPAKETRARRKTCLPRARSPRKDEAFPTFRRPGFDANFDIRQRAAIIPPLFHAVLESNMYAVVKTGGKQYRVCVGQKIKVEQIPAEDGAEITLDQVLMLGEGEDVKVGAPLVAGASVKCTVVSHGRHDKIKIFKMRRRKHYQKHQGHRQNYTELRIDAIVA